MKPRWKIRRRREAGSVVVWDVYWGDHPVPFTSFNVWENALTFVDIQEAGA